MIYIAIQAVKKLAEILDQLLRSLGQHLASLVANVLTWSISCIAQNNHTVPQSLFAPVSLFGRYHMLLATLCVFLFVCYLAAIEDTICDELLLRAQDPDTRAEINGFVQQYFSGSERTFLLTASAQQLLDN